MEKPETVINPNQFHRRGRQGKKFKSRKQRKFEQEKRKNDNRNDTRDGKPGYSEIVRANPNFDSYYKLQNIVEDDHEWNQMMESLKKPLPSSFRISSFCTGQTDIMRDFIQSDSIMSYVDNKDEVGEDDQKAEDISNKNSEVAISPILWYPNRLAWQFSLSKVEIRKSPVLGRLHKFLISETETGDISRQEAVSMIPPLLLDVKPGHSVLDMCAAPGSKTAQIIEMLHQKSNDNFLIDENGESTIKDGDNLDGLVVANDVDNRRCYMLVHQSKRLHSPSVVITNHDASMMPNFYKRDKDNKKVPLKFDRVLADVPCTGDGTFRKNYDVWVKWNVANSNNFHYIQLKIAKRGLELLAKDGIMAYSTCSLNPAEDEAVIATLLNWGQGSLELVDAAPLLPELKCRPGLESWTIMSRDMKVCNSFADVPESMQTQIRETLFPPENVAELNLKRCIRVLPHYQNTGGFFIAILRKKTDKLPSQNNGKASRENGNEVVVEESVSNETTPTFATAAAPSVVVVDDNKLDEQQKKKKGYYFGHREDPFYFFDEKDEDWPVIKKYYNFPDSFSYKQLAHRCTTGKRRNVYYITEKAANFIVNNQHVKIITGGCRVFNRVDVNNVKCAYRITQEGISSLFPFFINNLDSFKPDLSQPIVEDEDAKPKDLTVSKKLLSNERFNIVQLDIDHFVRLLKFDDVKMEDFDSEKYRPSIDRLSHGCCLFYVKLPRPAPNQLSSFILPICAWKGKNHIRAYVAKKDRVHLLRLCGEEPVEVVAPADADEDGKVEEDGDDNDKGVKRSEEDGDGVEDDDQNLTKVESKRIKTTDQTD